MTNKLYTEGEYLKNNPGWHTEDSAWKAKQIIPDAPFWIKGYFAGKRPFQGKFGF